MNFVFLNKINTYQTASVDVYLKDEQIDIVKYYLETDSNNTFTKFNIIS